MANNTAYYAFLLRLWKEKKEGKDAWRVTLEDPHTGEQKGFSELEELFNFLHQMTSPANPTDPKKAS